MLPQIPQRRFLLHLSCDPDIADEELAAAPMWPEVDARPAPLILGREPVSWNASFDRRVLRRSGSLHGLTLPDLTWHCTMSWGAQVWGKYSEDHDDFRWVNLDEVCWSEGVRLNHRRHRAAGDGQRLSARMDAVAVAQLVKEPAA